jgi:hypothetical protein
VEAGAEGITRGGKEQPWTPRNGHGHAWRRSDAALPRRGRGARAPCGGGTRARAASQLCSRAVAVAVVCARRRCAARSSLSALRVRSMLPCAAVLNG